MKETLVRRCMCCGNVFGCTINGMKYNCYDCKKSCELCEDNHNFDISTGVCDKCYNGIRKLREL